MAVRDLLWHNTFSHVYVEEGAEGHILTEKILSRPSDAVVIPIKHYKDVFAPPRQDYLVQKNSPKLILAVKRGGFLYAGSKNCFDYGYESFHNTSQAINCPFNCAYCYLQGKYPSANIVVFVNIEDTFAEVKRVLSGKSAFLCISYDTDLLALERLTGFTREWAGFAAENDNITVELRTKSADFSSLADVCPVNNMILAWTLSPDEIIEAYEQRAPALSDRINAVNAAIAAGWRVRLCFDPVLYLNNLTPYRNMLTRAAAEIPLDKILDACVGPFRAPRAYIKKMDKLNPCSRVLAYPFEERDGSCVYRSEHIAEIYGLFESYLSNNLNTYSSE